VRRAATQDLEALRHCATKAQRVDGGGVDVVGAVGEINAFLPSGVVDVFFERASAKGRAVGGAEGPQDGAEGGAFGI